MTPGFKPGGGGLKAASVGSIPTRLRQPTLPQPLLPGAAFFYQARVACANLDIQSFLERGGKMKTFFSEKNIEDRFTMIMSEIEEDVKRLDLPDVVEIGRQRSIETLYRRYSLGSVELDLKRMKLSELKKIEIGRVEKNGRPVPVYKSHVVVSIPYVGPESLFDYTPTRTNGPAPTGELADGNVILALPIEGASEKIRQEVESLSTYTGLINNDAKEFNKNLMDSLEHRIEERRGEIEREQEEYKKVEAFVNEHNKLRWS